MTEFFSAPLFCRGELGKRAVYGVEDDMVQLDLHNLGGKGREKMEKKREAQRLLKLIGAEGNGSSKFEGSRGFAGYNEKTRK